LFAVSAEEPTSVMLVT
jgi:hypothetical protein